MIDLNNWVKKYQNDETTGLNQWPARDLPRWEHAAVQENGLRGNIALFAAFILLVWSLHRHALSEIAGIVGSEIPRLTSKQLVCYIYIPLVSEPPAHGSNAAILCLEDAPWYCDPVWYCDVEEPCFGVSFSETPSA